LLHITAPLLLRRRCNHADAPLSLAVVAAPLSPRRLGRAIFATPLLPIRRSVGEHR
jgi:hypothetical protein